MSKTKDELVHEFAVKTLDKLSEDVAELMGKYRNVEDKFIAGAHYYEMMTDALVRGCFRICNSFKDEDRKMENKEHTMTILHEIVTEAAVEAGLDVRVIEVEPGIDEKITLH